MKQEKIIRLKTTNCGDPFIIIEDGIYYSFGTDNGENLKCQKSSNGINFEFASIALSKENSFGEKDFWAPEVIKYKDEFFMFYSARNKEGLLLVSVAKSKCVTGPYVDVDKNHPLLGHLGYASIDASPFIDNDGKAYILFAKECSTNIIDGVHVSESYIITLDETLTKTKGEPIFLSTPTESWEKYDVDDYTWNEGPNVLFHNGLYYLTYSCHHFIDPNYCVGCSYAKKITGPYTKMKEGPILKRIPNVISGPGHSSFLKDKDNIYIVYHVHTDMNDPHIGRSVCMSKVCFDKLVDPTGIEPAT